MKEEIYKICTQLNDGQIAVVEAQEQLLILFDVSNRRKQLIAFADAINVHDGDNEKIGKLVDLYLKSN